MGTASTSDTFYTRAPDGTLLAERTPSTDYYYVQDANGSVVALTDSSDNVASTYTYDPFGTTTSSTGSAPNSFGFDGGYYGSCVNGAGANCPSSTTQQGLILFGTRYYNPATGTWTQPDPAAQVLVSDPTQADPYGFAGDDPINTVDPTGEAGEGGEALDAEPNGDGSFELGGFSTFGGGLDGFGPNSGDDGPSTTDMVKYGSQNVGAAVAAFVTVRLPVLFDALSDAVDDINNSGGAIDGVRTL